MPDLRQNSARTDRGGFSHVPDPPSGRRLSLPGWSGAHRGVGIGRARLAERRLSGPLGGRSRDCRAGAQGAFAQICRRVAVSGDLGVFARSVDRRPAGAIPRLVSAGLSGVKPFDPSLAADLADRLDSAGDLVVRSVGGLRRFSLFFWRASFRSRCRRPRPCRACSRST